MPATIHILRVGGERALDACHGNNKRAAAKLSLTYDQLKHLKKRLQI